MVSVPLFAISNIATLHMTFSFTNKVLWVPPPSILTIANPDISPINGAFPFTNYCSLGFKIMQSIGKMGND